MSNNSTKIDVNKVSFYGEENLNLDDIMIHNEIDDLDIASMLKISHCQNVKANHVIIGQGAENAVDISCSENVSLSGIFGAIGIPCDQVITVKGGCRNINLYRYIDTPATKRKAHIEIGNWMDQSYKINKDITLDFIGQDKIYVAVGWAVPFSVKLKSNCKYLFWRSVGLKFYWLAKFLIRLVMRIPKGTKGPNWF
jgi:hypothetical protein